MKALKTKVILSAFVLLFALVATIGSTYAWFTVSNTVSVSAFNLEVQTSPSLLIRLWDEVNGDTADGTWTATDFKNTIAASDFTSSTYYDELTKQEHKKVNHRLKALKKLVKKLKV